jgi:hypothetical protein
MVMKTVTVFLSSVFCFLILSGLCYAENGRVFYYEDFSSVTVGHLPNNWLGGEKMLVKSERGKKHLTAFERGDHSAVIKNIKYPKNFEIRVIGYCSGAWDHFIFSTGSANFGTKSHECWLNKSKMDLKEGIEGKTFTLIFRKEGPVLSLQINGNDPIITREPNFKFTDSFSLGFNFQINKIYEIRMTDIGN